MKLKNANPNGCNAVINNLYPLIICFSENIKIEFTKFILEQKFHNARKLKLFITFISLIKMEWFKAFHTYVNLENHFEIFIYEESDFFIYPNYPSSETNYRLHNNV